MGDTADGRAGGRDALTAALYAALGTPLGSWEVAGRPLAEALADAVEDGRLTWDGSRLALPVPRDDLVSPWVFHQPADSDPSPQAGARDHYLPCWYLNRVLFDVAYERTAVPLGCRECFKVKVEVDSVAELVVLRDHAKQIPCPSKCGSELGHLFSRSLWSAYFYVDGLESALAVHGQVRALLDGHPRLAAARTSIKRGCTSYEVACGPSDRWRFDDSLAPLEEGLRSLCAPPPENEPNKYTAYLGWIEAAFSIGDDSYLELTRGKPLYPPLVDYLARS